MGKRVTYLVGRINLKKRIQNMNSGLHMIE